MWAIQSVPSVTCSKFCEISSKSVVWNKYNMIQYRWLNQSYYWAEFLNMKILCQYEFFKVVKVCSISSCLGYVCDELIQEITLFWFVWHFWSEFASETDFFFEHSFLLLQTTFFLLPLRVFSFQPHKNRKSHQCSRYQEWSPLVVADIQLSHSFSRVKTSSRPFSFFCSCLRITQ